MTTEQRAFVEKLLGELWRANRDGIFHPAQPADKREGAFAKAKERTSARRAEYERLFPMEEQAHERVS